MRADIEYLGAAVKLKLVDSSWPPDRQTKKQPYLEPSTLSGRSQTFPEFGRSPHPCDVISSSGGMHRVHTFFLKLAHMHLSLLACFLPSASAIAPARLLPTGRGRVGVQVMMRLTKLV